MVNFCAECGCCTRTDIVREHLEDTLRICDVNAMGLLCICLFAKASNQLINASIYHSGLPSPKSLPN
jgi:hypothetical protein